MGLAKYREDDILIMDERVGSHLDVWTGIDDRTLPSPRERTDGVFGYAPRLRPNAKEVKVRCC
ncbi:MAG: hypothetical protein IK104_03190 [Clostridia bacterium]|nr:hypothetical protein [Clostridia bacterium]